MKIFLKTTKSWVKSKSNFLIFSSSAFSNLILLFLNIKNGINHKPEQVLTHYESDTGR